MFNAVCTPLRAECGAEVGYAKGCDNTDCQYPVLLRRSGSGAGCFAQPRAALTPLDWSEPSRGLIEL
jgi:hypothetical protein